MRTPPSRTRGRRALTIAASLSALLLPAAAADGAQTFPDPSGSGASITLDKTTVAPGEWIQVDAAGFVGGAGNGDPLVTLRPYDFDRGPEWQVEGNFADIGPWSSEAKLWFRTQQPGGTFSARLQLPPTAQVDGPPPGGLAGNHFIRVLSGAPFTTTGSSLTPPITYQVPFTVIERAALGLTSPSATGPVYQAGTTFRAGPPGGGPGGPTVTVTGDRFTPNATLAVELDDAPLATTTPTTITTDGTGRIPDGVTVKLPTSDLPGGAPGAHVLRFATGDVAHAVPVRITAPPTATIDTPTVRPGGTFAVALKDYIGVRGTGQKVAIVINEQVLACVTAADDGTGHGTATLPAALPSGPVTVGFNVGLSCVPPPSPLNDLPGSRLTPSLTIADDAPSLAVPNGIRGTAVAASGDGFTPGAAATATYRGATLASSLSVDGTGRLSGTVTLPGLAGTGPVVVTAGTTKAAAAITVTDPPPAIDPPVVPTVPLVPTVPTVPKPPGPKPLVVAGKTGSLKAKKGNRTLRFVLKGGSKASTRITIRTKAKVRLSKKSRAKVITLAVRTLTKAGTYELKLTKDGRALLKRYRSVKVVVTIAPQGGKATKQTLPLRRG